MSIEVQLHPITNEDIKKKLPKLSDAVMSMMHGMIDFASKPKYHLNMGTFGAEEPDGQCYGCMATACVLATWQDLPVSRRKRSKLTTIVSLETQEWLPFLAYFEDHIDKARKGRWVNLCNFYDIDYHKDLPSSLQAKMNGIRIWSDNWHYYIPALCSIAKELRKLEL